MSRLYEALKRLDERGASNEFAAELVQPVEILNKAIDANSELDGVPVAKLKVSPRARLAALSANRSLGAEKFRALTNRLESIRHQRELRSIQVTSSVVGEGKSLVAANLAITLASYGKSRVLLMEGDLHRPTLANLFGLGQVKGLTEWWVNSAGDDVASYMQRFAEMPLTFLGAGAPVEQPAAMIQSERFKKAISSISTHFDWVVVDSTPMQPIIDANLWSRIVDGTLLVVREGVGTIHALKKGLESFDNLNLIGVILNGASEVHQNGYGYAYYGSK